MITVNKALTLPIGAVPSMIAPPERLVFFDIETTGLSAERSNLYLIGIVHYENGSWRLLQYFAESMEDEPKLLEAFFDLLAQKKKAAGTGRVFLVHYNGEGFDLPFLKKCIAQYRLPYSFDDVFSFDLFRKVRDLKKPLGLENCKLKTVERFLGIFREDAYSGGELIYVYEEYLRLRALPEESCEANAQNKALLRHLLDTLLLHNAEDLSNLPSICAILSYESLFQGAFSLEHAAVENLPAANGTSHVLDLSFRLEQALPKELAAETDAYSFSVSGSDKYLFQLLVTLYEGELKYFFVDYKNYYYLPEEDCAIHKSVGEFVAKRQRRQATARTCYQKKQGLFLPEPALIFTPVFYSGYKETPAYAAFDQNMLSEAQKWKDYALSVLQSF